MGSVDWLTFAYSIVKAANFVRVSLDLSDILNIMLS